MHGNGGGGGGVWGALLSCRLEGTLSVCKCSRKNVILQERDVQIKCRPG